MRLLVALVATRLLLAGSADAADLRRALLDTPPVKPVTEFPNAFMGSLADGVLTEQQHGSSWVLKDAALAGLGQAGLAAAKVLIQPCSMAGLHFHKDANEVVFQVSGTQNYTVFVDGKMATRRLVPGDVAFAPAGALHIGVNDGCEPETHLVYWSSLNTTRVLPASELFLFPDEMVAATFGVEDVAALRKAVDIAPIDRAFAFLPLPAGSGCAARCAALKASGEAEPAPAAEPATNFSMSIAGMAPQLDSELGAFRTVTAAQLPGLSQLAGSGATLNLGTIKPCSVLLPHMHPNADEMVYVLEGSVDFNQIDAETGAVYRGQLKGPDDVVITPRTSLHGYWNPSCEEVRLLSVMNVGTPKRTYPATELLQLPSEDVRGMLGYRGSAAELDANLDPPAPPLAALRADSKCQARCKAAAGGEKE